VNRQFYKEELCHGDLRLAIAHPDVKGGKLFLLFDPVHLFKNFYTNFLNRQEFVCPDFNGEAITARFEHIEELYQHELGKSLKIVHKLTRKVLCPRAIERSNVSLPDRFFHESTIAALDFYADNEGKVSWRETACFLRVIRVWWNIQRAVLLEAKRETR